VPWCCTCCHTAVQADLKQLPLTLDTFGTKFDVVLIDPPWEEYVRRAPGADAVSDSWPWQDIQALDVGNIADSPAFVFLW
jgi:mRNA m6A methyltransferase non-catalytic subunit